MNSADGDVFYAAIVIVLTLTSIGGLFYAFGKLHEDDTVEKTGMKQR